MNVSNESALVGLLYSLVAWKICLYHNQLPVDTCIINENKGGMVVWWYGNLIKFNQSILLK